jgi:transposase
LKKKLDAIGNNFISIDECAIHLKTQPNKGWSRKGRRCRKKAPVNRGKKFSYISAIDKDGIIGRRKVKGSINGERFIDFLKNDIMPKTNDRIILMDNAMIHKSKKVTEFLKANAFTIIFNIPYSPQYNPIELVFNNIKDHIKKVQLTQKNN